MLGTTLVLLFFASLVIWHDTPSESPEQQNVIQDLIQNNLELKTFLARLPVNKRVPAFYSVGLPGKQPWPQSYERACYADPLAARWQFATIREAFSNEIEVVRYRSSSDFLELLLTAEKAQPGFINKLNLPSHTAVKENPWAVSLKSLVAFLVGGLGLMVVRQVKNYRRIKHSR